MDTNKRFEVVFAPKEGETAERVDGETSAEVDRMATAMAKERGGTGALLVGTEQRGNLLVWTFDIIRESEPTSETPKPSTDPAETTSPPAELPTARAAPSESGWGRKLECQKALREAGLPSPRTCEICGWGPCQLPGSRIHPDAPDADGAHDDIGTDAGIARAIRRALDDVHALAEKAKVRGIEVDFSVWHESIVAKIRRPL